MIFIIQDLIILKIMKTILLMLIIIIEIFECKIQQDYLCISDQDDQMIELKSNEHCGSKTSYLTARYDRKLLMERDWHLNNQQCKPIYLYFLGRHSIRFPGLKEIIKQERLMPKYAKIISKNGTKLSNGIRHDLHYWTLMYDQTDQYHVTLSGKYETQTIGKLQTR